MTDATLDSRIDRLESAEAIRQLVAQYALACDMRDLDALVDLYVEDVEVGRGKVGRAALRELMARMLGLYRTTIHLNANHVIDFKGADRATGNVYLLGQFEMNGAWVTSQGMYHDEYERHDGRWLFRQRTPLLAYAGEAPAIPTGDDSLCWPGVPAGRAMMHLYSPAVASFPDAPATEGSEAAAAGFINRIRGGTPLPSPRR